MGVMTTWCQLCGLPCEHTHYVPTDEGMLFTISYGSENPRSSGEEDGPFAFDASHRWLRQVVGLRQFGDGPKVIHGIVEEGFLHYDGNKLAEVFQDGEEYLPLHRMCWELSGKPVEAAWFAPARSLHERVILEIYQRQLFDFHQFAKRGHAWMLADPGHSDRSRSRIEALVKAVQKATLNRNELHPSTVRTVLERDLNWMAKYVGTHKGFFLRTRTDIHPDIDRSEYPTLFRLKIVGSHDGFERQLKAHLEADQLCILVSARITNTHSIFTIYTRDPDACRKRFDEIEPIALHWARIDDDPEWKEYFEKDYLLLPRVTDSQDSGLRTTDLVASIAWARLGISYVSRLKQSNSDGADRQSLESRKALLIKTLRRDRGRGDANCICTPFEISNKSTRGRP